MIFNRPNDQPDRQQINLIIDALSRMEGGEDVSTEQSPLPKRQKIKALGYRYQWMNIGGRTIRSGNYQAPRSGFPVVRCSIVVW